jgi:hypothetical protein
VTVENQQAVGEGGSLEDAFEDLKGKLEHGFGKGKHPNLKIRIEIDAEVWSPGGISQYRVIATP